MYAFVCISTHTHVYLPLHTSKNTHALFSDNKFKQEIINKKIGDDDITTAYRCGPLIDLCRGPHVQHTGKIKTFEVTSHSSAYWLGKATNPSLQV